MMSANRPIIKKRAIPPITKDAMSQRARDIIAATMTDLSAGDLLCSETFLASSDQVGRARALLKHKLVGHPACGTAMLLVSELATNSVRHSGSTFFGLTVTHIVGDGLRIVVIDEGQAGIPHLQDRSTDAESGRGMTLVDLLAERWGVVRQAGLGVAVWFECTA